MIERIKKALSVLFCNQENIKPEFMRVIEFSEGDLFFLECDRRLSMDQINMLTHYIEELRAGRLRGVGVLDGGVRLLVATKKVTA